MVRAVYMCIFLFFFFFFKQKTAYEMSIGDWSSDVCSSDLDTHSKFADRSRCLAQVCACCRRLVVTVRPPCRATDRQLRSSDGAARRTLPGQHRPCCREAPQHRSARSSSSLPKECEQAECVPDRHPKIRPRAHI